MSMSDNLYSELLITGRQQTATQFQLTALIMRTQELMIRCMYLVYKLDYKLQLQIFPTMNVHTLLAHHVVVMYITCTKSQSANKCISNIE